MGVKRGYAGGEHPVEGRLAEGGVDGLDVGGDARRLEDVGLRGGGGDDGEMRPRDGDGERPLIVSGNVDEDLVGCVMARGFLQMLGEDLRIGGGDGDAGRARRVIGEPAGDRAVAVEIDDVDARPGLGVGARERDACGGFADAALGGGKSDDQGTPQLAQKRKSVNAPMQYVIRGRNVVQNDSRARCERLENAPDAIAAPSGQFAHRRSKLAQHGPARPEG